MKILGTAASLALLVGAAPVSAATMQWILIDDFSTDQRVVDEPQGGVPNESEVAAPNAIGEYRDLAVRTASGLEDATELRAVEGALGFSNVANATGEGWITYDGNDGDPFNVDTDGLEGIDLDRGPNPFFSFDVLGFDKDLFVEVRVWDIFDGYSSYSEILPEESEFSPNLYFTQFTGNADFNNVGALQFYVRADNAALDGRIDKIEVGYIPLPAPALLLLGGLGALGIGARRRRKSA